MDKYVVRGYVIDDKYNFVCDKIKICGVFCLELMYNMLKIIVNFCKFIFE